MTVVLIALIAPIAGCWSGSHIARDRLFQGPAMRLTNLDDDHVVVVQSPSPGWSAQIDRVERELNHADVFVTLRRPDPGIIYTQAVVEQHLLTNVELDRPVAVYARTVDFSQTRKKGPYRQAIRPATTN
jgi:hypothetical protein